MAFGVVVAGTGALSGMGGQKRYRVNRFRRDLLFRGLGIELTSKALPRYGIWTCAYACEISSERDNGQRNRCSLAFSSAYRENDKDFYLIESRFLFSSTFRYIDEN